MTKNALQILADRAAKSPKMQEEYRKARKEMFMEDLIKFVLEHGDNGLEYHDVLIRDAIREFFKKNDI